MKHEWPKKWPNFISDIVEASKTSESMCQNNLEILKLLRFKIFNYCFILIMVVLFNSEEVFDFSSGQMTQAKAKHLKDTMCNEFTKIFQLCEYVVVRKLLFLLFLRLNFIYRIDHVIHHCFWLHWKHFYVF